MVTDITKQDIEEGLLAEHGVLNVIMFYGATCGPCKGTMPHYEAAAETFTQKTPRIRFYRLHAWDDEHTEYCKTTWGVEGVPHFKLMCNGTMVSERRGGGDLDGMTKMVHEGIDQTFKQLGERI